MVGVRVGLRRMRAWGLGGELRVLSKSKGEEKEKDISKWRTGLYSCLEEGKE